MARKPLIASDQVEHTVVYDRNGNSIGSIKRLMIEKISGRVVYAVMSFGAFLGLGTQEHIVPWTALVYDPDLGGYRVHVSQAQLRDAPTCSGESEYDWTDRSKEQEIHRHYGIAPYWTY